MSDKLPLHELIRSHRSGYALQQQFYTDPDVYRLELDRIIFKHWILAGHESQLAEPGDFLTLQVDKESAIVVRGSDGRIKAFANVCRHRGSVICLSDHGSVKNFQCPYHGWMYDIDGNLKAARSMGKDFDKSAYSLRPVSLEVLSGLIFVSFSDSPPSMASARAELTEPLEFFGIENLRVAARKEYPIDANWKLAIENYQECYHCATAHPHYAKMHTLMLDDSRRERLQHSMYESDEACGLRRIEIDRFNENSPPGESPYYYWRNALFDGYQTGSRDGQPVAPLIGKVQDYSNGTSDWGFGPFSFMLSYSDHVVAYVFTPTGPDSCNCTLYWLVRDDAREGVDYVVDDLTWLWDVTTESDKEIIINNWRGVCSRYYQPGPFSNMEDWERGYVDWLIAELDDAA